MVFFEVCGEDEVMILSGWRYSDPLTKPHQVSGTCVFVLPCVQKVQRLCTSLITLEIESKHVGAKNGIDISAVGVAQIRIVNQNDEMLLAACEHFLDKSEGQIRKIALEKMVCHQSDIMRAMTVEDIYFDRRTFCTKVFELAASDLINMGISVCSYTLKDVMDHEGHLKAIGEARRAQAKTTP